MSTCNICTYTGEFLSHRDKPNRRCPKCSSLERHRIFFEYVENNDLLTNKHILHIAPEKSLCESIRKKSKKYYCLDQAPNKLYMSKDDLTDLNVFKDNTFDIVICFHVLEHIIDDIKAISEIKRVLKKTGIAFISVPLKNKNLFTHKWTEEEMNKSKEKGEWGIDGKFSGHVRDYGYVDLMNIFKKNFEEISFSNNKKFTSHDFFICKK